MGPTMPEKRNALAELAERLKSFVSENEMIFVDSDINALNRAQRIVAELAKCQTSEHAVSGVEELIANCRAIAEEGAGDGAKPL